MRDNLNAYKKQLQGIAEAMASQLALENDLAKKVSELREDLAAARSEYRPSSEAMGTLESELVSLEKRSQKLACWRTIALASYSLAALSLLARAPRAVPVLTVLASSSACFGIYRLLGFARKKVQTQRQRLLCATARAVAASTRLEKTQQELTIVENEYTAVRDSRERLTLEQESLRSNMKESSETLSTIETELGRLQESKVIEEKAHLLELLGVCVEVDHARRG